ncbi:hypothetical protein MNB_SV-13-762 [hydrothermal vent metagenome]|uniref:Uncharacterized protein n=1 Tax=hydrothermal vent metagenome TaxID=652676 RepID=A0A1W1CZ84_9ZZZZ
MHKSWLFFVFCSLLLAESKPITAEEAFERMGKVLSDKWSLSPKEAQIDSTGAYKNKAIAHLVGTQIMATEYKIIGGGATLQENLLPNTAKAMKTMYHCDDFVDCTQLKATHYCAKGNQPAFLLNEKKSTKDTFVFDCDMRTKLCNSDEDHVHTMIFELSNESNHLKASYLSWKYQKLKKKHSIYHFDRL